MYSGRQSWQHAIEFQGEIPLRSVSWRPRVVEYGHFRVISPDLVGYYLQSIDQQTPATVVDVLCKRLSISDVMDRVIIVLSCCVVVK